MAERLPEAAWTQRQDLAALVAAIGADELRWVGGAVRDTLLHTEVKDVDAATQRSPDEVIALLEQANIRTIPTGIAYGTVTAILPRGHVEITTLRHDVSTDGRRATVSFASDWREDAARRDFTINALYAHPETLEISDYFGGLDDLAARRVRFIGDARQRIREDHLRILRYFRFYARFGAASDTEAEQACAEAATLLHDLSRERVGWEILATLALPDPVEALERMHALHILPVVLPECRRHGLDQLARLIAAEVAAGIAPDPVRRLAALLPPVPEIAAETAYRLRLSNNQRARLRCAAARSTADIQNPHALSYLEGPECAADRLLLLGESPASVTDWPIPNLPLKGGAIIARGVAAGPAVARILRAVEQRWITEDFPSEARVLAILDEELTKE